MTVLLASSIWSDTGLEIMRKVIDVQKVKSSAMDIRMVLTNVKGDVSTRRIQTLMVDDEGLTKTITLFLEPASVKNTRFLTVQNESRNDDQWIYLPALRKVKRIVSSEKNGSFMGSDFSYSDMSYSDDTINSSTHTLLREEYLNEIECYVVESIPDENSSSSYGKEISWVDKKTWLTPKVEFYGADRTTLAKTLKSEEFQADSEPLDCRKNYYVEQRHRT